MADIDLVEQLRERVGVTYDDAKEALDACGDDLLDAIIYLEKQGKVAPPSGKGSYSSKEQSGYQSSDSYAPPKSQQDSFSTVLERFFSWIGSVLQMGTDNIFVVKRNGGTILSVPVLVLVLLLVFAFWFTAIAFIIGLFTNCRYMIKNSKSGRTYKNKHVTIIKDDFAAEFDGIADEIKKDISDSVNEVMEEIADITEQLKAEFRNHM